MKKPVQIEVKPVAWTNGKVNKYQAQASYQVNEDRKIRILSDPKPTKEEAMENLIAEIVTWTVAISEIRNAI